MGNILYTSFANLAASGNTANQATPADVSNVGVFFGTGVTFGAGTLKAQVSFDGGTTWLDVPSTGASITTGTANTKKADITVIGPLMRWNLAGATTPSLDLRQASREVRKCKVLQFTFTADGNVVFQIPYTGVDIAFAAYGTFGAGTLSFEVSPDGGTTWFIVDSLAAAGIKHILAANNQDAVARVKLTGSTAPALEVRAIL